MKTKLILLGIITLTFSELHAAQVKDIKFQHRGAQATLTILTDQDAEFEKTDAEADKQVIIDLKGSTINKTLARRIDTSQFAGNSALISPYQNGSNVRVVIQLKSNGSVDVEKEGNKITAKIDNSAFASSQTEQQTETTGNENATTTTASETVDQSPTASSPTTGSSENTAYSAETTSNKSSTETESALEQFIESQKSKNYVGRPINLNVKDTDLTDIFRVISEASDFNIVVSDLVRGKITMALSDVPWDQALDIILHSNKLGAERRGNVLRITTLEALTQENEARIAAKKVVEAAEPLVVKIFPISYAKLEDVSRIVREFLSREQNGQTVRGSLQMDERTNQLIVKDTPTNLEKLKRIIKELDTQTPQVLIEAKFVDVQENNSSALEGRIFVTQRELVNNQLVFGNRNNSALLFGGQNFNQLDPGFAITPAAGGGSFGFTPKIGLLPGLREIGAFLSIQESQSKVKVIASPRVVTQNKQQAEISQGNTAQIAIPPAANTPGGFQTVNLTLRLQVTPQITNDGGVILKINFSQDAPSATLLGGSTLTTDSKRVDTQVLVESGSTIVIGGIYQSNEQESEAGIPFLRNLPLIGPLFGSKGKRQGKSELFIFLTPRILNEKESGIKAG